MSLRRIALAALFALAPAALRAQNITALPTCICQSTGANLTVTATQNAQFAGVVYLNFQGLRFFLRGGVGNFNFTIPVPASTWFGTVAFELYSIDLNNPALGLQTRVAQVSYFAISFQNEFPAPTNGNLNRQRIGLGERVTFFTQPGCTLNWSVDNGGTITPAMGTGATLTSRLDPTRHTVVGAFGVQRCQLVFDVEAPTGVSYTYRSQTDPAMPGPPNNRIGMDTRFRFDIAPSDVCFSRLSMRENIPAQNWTWPDGTADTRGAATVAFSGPVPPNILVDNIAHTLRPIGRLRQANGTWVDFDFNINVPLERQNAAGNWVVWLQNNGHRRNYIGAAIATRGQAWIRTEATNNATSPPQGPYQ